MSRDSRDYSKEELDAGCIAYPWLLTLGQMLTTATLVAKLYRVKKVCKTRTGSANMVERAKVTVKDVSGLIVGGLAVDIIILGIWFGLDPFKWTVQVVSQDFNGVVLSLNV